MAAAQPIRDVVFAGPADNGETTSAASVYSALLDCGLQASVFGDAVLRWRRVVCDRRTRGPAKVGIILAYTSNMVSCGLREVFSFLIRSGHVDAVIATAGGLEEDVIKCLGDTLVGDFALPGAKLRGDHMNRVGNLLIPNDNYVNFEDFFVPVLKDVHRRQCASRATEGTTPSEILAAMGERLVQSPGVPVQRVEDSVVASCHVAEVPMFCPAFTDGSMGDMLFFYNINQKGLIVDPHKDERQLRRLVGAFEEVNVLCVGAGLPKHNILRAVARSPSTKLGAVLLQTTSREEDGCTSSGSPIDDISAGQRDPQTYVSRIVGDATLTFPAFVASVFVKERQ